MRATAILASAIVLTVVSYVLTGVTLSTLWGWFIVPPLDAPPLSIPAAIGISLVVRLVTHQRIDSPGSGDKSASDTIAEDLGYAVAFPLILLATGWVVTLFMP